MVDDFEVVAARIKPTTNCNGKRVDAKVSDVEVARTLTELVELHINILRWISQVHGSDPKDLTLNALELNFLRFFDSIMDSTQKLFSGPFFFQFFMFVMSIVLEIHSIETGLGHFTFESFVCFEVVLLQIGICYAICYVGTILTARAEEIADFVYDIDWFTLKITQQKTIINIMNQGQSPFVMSGWGFVSCTLETFATVKWTFLLLIFLESDHSDHISFILIIWFFCMAFVHTDDAELVLVLHHFTSIWKLNDPEV